MTFFPPCFLRAVTFLLITGSLVCAAAETPEPATEAKPETSKDPEPVLNHFYIREYRVQGVKHLPALDVEKAVYPFLGPRRTAEDVEQARAALQKAYDEKGYKTVTVEIPPQEPKRGVVKLLAVENTVGRLRVHGAKYFSISQIKKQVPSMAEGTVVDFNKVTKELIALNQLADRQVSPSLKPGVEPGTVDIDLEVKDKLPLHGNLELNNRYSPDTTELRVNGGISYNNLWQKGHAAGFNFQVAPENTDDAKVYSAYYLMRFEKLDGFSLMFNGTKQDSNISTLGGAAVAGRGEIIGVRGLFTLPGANQFYHSLSVGVDYKHFGENVIVGTDEVSTPITYWPASLSYGATWTQKHGFTELNAATTMHFRGSGSDPAEFDAKRYKADGGFFHFRCDLAHTQDLPLGLQVYGKVQGQASANSLINSEQISGGGLGTVRGYLESTALGDQGIFGTLELRTPSLLGFMNPKVDGKRDPEKEKHNEWRFYGFVDGGRLTLNDPLPDQVSSFVLASWGVGTRIKLLNHLNGSVDAGFPLKEAGTIKKNDLLLTFRLWTEF